MLYKKFSSNYLNTLKGGTPIILFDWLHPEFHLNLSYNSAKNKTSEFLCLFQLSGNEPSKAIAEPAWSRTEQPQNCRKKAMEPIQHRATAEPTWSRCVAAA